MRYLRPTLLVLLSTSMFVSCASVRPTALAETCRDAKTSAPAAPVENALLLCSPVTFLCSNT